MTFDEAAKKWGGRLSTAIPKKCWEEIEKRIKPGMRTLEFGSGLSTILFRSQPVTHTALESDPEYVTDGTTYIPAGEDGWYQDVPIRAFDLILLDGPRGVENRYGFLDVVENHGIVVNGTVIVIDDTHTDDGYDIAMRTAKICERYLRLYYAGDRQFAIVSAERFSPQ